MFQDYENIPESFISESYISDKLFDLINFDTHIDIQQISDFIEYYGFDIDKIDIEEIIDFIGDKFCCSDDDFENYCWEMAECSYGSDIIESGYFDISKYMRDMEYDFDLINGNYYYQH